MRKLLRLLLATGILLTGFFASAQERTVRGVILADDTKAPLPGVTVTNRNTQKSTQTDNSGVFTISAADGHVLVLSYVGYAQRQITVAANTNFNVVMTATAGQLEEVTISQGIRRQSRALGYATQKVSGEDLTVANRDNFFTALQGRVSGLTVTPTSGVPGASAQIILRGPVSFDGNNQPLIVVDGLPISNKTISQGNLISDRPNRDNDYSNRAIDINPEDIEDVTILTGPEAAALYGTEGASGVILITTKRAKAGATRVTYGTSLTATRKPELPEIQTIYDQGTNGVVNNLTRTYFGPKYAEGTPIYDNRNKFFRVAFSQKHDLSVEGGTEKLTFRFSPSFSRYDGTVPNTRFDRTSLRLTTTSQISDKLRMDAAFNYINTDNKKGSKGANSYFLSLLSWPSDDDITDYLRPDGTRRNIAGVGVNEIDNPFWDVNRNINRDKTSRFLGNVSVTYSPLNWLSVTGRFGGDIYTTEGNRTYHPLSFSGFSVGGLLENYVDNTRYYNGSLVANARGNFGDFSVKGSVGGNFDNNSSDIVSYKGEKFYVADYNSVNNTDPATQRSLRSIIETKKFGFFGNTELGYKQTIYLSLTGRVDASSNLIPNDPYFFYPGAGLSFIFSELTKNRLPWLTYGKLRVNAGTTGKDPRRPFLTSSRLDPQLSNGGGFILNVTLGNPNLKAEYTRVYEFGTELKFLNNRIGFDITYYNQKSKDQITAPRLSYGTGGVLAYLNSGEVENKGIQAQLNVLPVQNKNFRWRSIVNFTKNSGRIISTPANQKVFYLSDTWLYAGVRAEFSLGESISSLASQGFLKNNNGQVIISPTSGLPVRDINFTQRGDRAPDFSMGFVNQFTYKNWNFSFVFDMRKGGDIFNGNELYLTTIGLSKKTLDRETPRVIEGVLQDGLENTANPTKNTIVVIPYYNNGYYNSSYSEEEFIESDINWLRCQDVSLSYVLPSKLVSRTRVFKGVTVGLSAANLFILTNYSGVDPAVSGLNASAGGFGGTGIDYAVLPSAKTVTFSLNLRF
ncbi:MAG TPA: SusC/RagA family TonB-linked outer membrane protein [Chitinophagaceae bacterium]